MSEQTIVVENLALADISLEKRIALRPPQTDSPEFEYLKQSINEYGLKQPIEVREDAENPGKYKVIDGTQRFTIAGLLGWSAIPAIVKRSVADLDVMISQIQSNVQRVVTKPAQVGKMILQIIAADPTGTLTLGDVAKMLCMSVEQIQHRIQLVKLNDQIKEVVDNGGVSIQKAVLIANLPPSEQEHFLAMAQSQMSTQEFLKNATERIKQVKEAEKAGRKASAPVFTPAGKLRTRAEIEAEITSGTARASIVTKNMTSLDAFTAALNWAISMDTASVRAAEVKFNEMQEARAKKEAEKAKKAEAAQAAVEGI